MSRPTPPGRQPTNGKIITVAQRFSPRSEGSKTLIRLSSSGVPHWEDKPPEHLALKVRGDYLQESQKAVQNRDSTPKGYTQNLTHSGTQGKSSNSKGAWVRLTC